MGQDILITTKEAAKILGVHVNTIRTMIEDGRLKGTKTGENGHWRFLKSDIEKFIQNTSEKDADSILNNAIYFLEDIPEELNDKGYGCTLWNTVNKYFGIRTVFGSMAIHADMSKYIEIIEKKSFQWIGEGFCNFMDEHNYLKMTGKKSQESIASKMIFSTNFQMAFGVVKFPSMFDTYSYSTVSLLVVTDNNNKKWVVDGTLQQFYSNMKKGLVILPYAKAKEVYISLEVYNRAEFAELFGDADISEKFIQKAKRIEQEKENKDSTI